MTEKHRGSLELSDVTVAIAGATIVEDVTVRADAGELVGLVGPNGSGKSTTLGCVYRTLTPRSGAVVLDGRDLRAVSLRETARTVAALTQDHQVEFDFTVAEIVATGRTPHPKQGREHDAAVCAAALDQVGVAHLADRSYLTLSGGERQRVQIARALAQQPRLLVLDEPTNHLDIHHQIEVLALVRRLGITVLAALHDLNLAAAWCDRIHVLDRGRVVAAGPPGEVLTPELVAAVFRVRAHVVRHPGSGARRLLFDALTPDALTPDSPPAATAVRTEVAP